MNYENYTIRRIEKRGIEREGINCLRILGLALKDIIPVELYSIGGYREESFCIEKQLNNWIVYIGERGNKHDIKYFYNAKQACLELISRVSESDEQEKLIKYIFDFYIAGYQDISMSDKNNTKMIDNVPAFSKSEAISLVKYHGTFSQMDNTINAHINIESGSRRFNRLVNGVVVLPNKIRENDIIVVFAKDNKVIEAKKAGADYVGGEEIVSRIIDNGWLDFDAVIATPDMMNVVSRLDKILKPRGLMPTFKTGTVTTDVTRAVKEIKAGKIEYQIDKSNYVHVPVGKTSFTEEALQQNFDALMDSILKKKPRTAKAEYVKNVILSSDKEFAVKVNLTTIESVSREVCAYS